MPETMPLPFPDGLEEAVTAASAPDGRIAVWVDRSELAAIVTGRAALSAPDAHERRVHALLPSVSQPRYAGTVPLEGAADGIEGAKAVLDGFGDRQVYRKLWLDPDRFRSLAGSSAEAVEAASAVLAVSAVRGRAIESRRVVPLPVRSGPGRGS